jgi:hypothetical protein
MIQVALTCAKDGPIVGRFARCPEYQATLAPGDVEQWVEATLREHGWYADPDSGEYFCPDHNPTDAGLVVEIGPQRAYTPLGESGWEARWAEELGGSAEIEIRPVREGVAP